MLVPKKYTRLPAFTILELMVGLVVTAIVIAMVYFIYTNISRQVISYMAQQQELMEYNQFQSIWHQDVQGCKTIMIKDNRHLVLHMPQQKITYRFTPEYILRRTRTLDTFWVPAKEVKITPVADDVKEARYQTIRIQTVLLEQEIEIFEEKKVALADQINNFFIKK